MIFILLGILILIAAFAIALVSLIREQKSAENVINHVYKKPDEPEEITAKEKEAVGEPTVSLEKAVQPAERKPFPWEMTEGGNNKPVTGRPESETVSPDSNFEFGGSVESRKEQSGEETEFDTREPSYNPSLPSGGVVEISMKDMIESSKNSEGS